MKRKGKSEASIKRQDTQYDNLAAGGDENPVTFASFSNSQPNKQRSKADLDSAEYLAVGVSTPYALPAASGPARSQSRSAGGGARRC